MKNFRFLSLTLLALLGAVLLVACAAGTGTAGSSGNGTGGNEQPAVYTLSVEGARTEFAHLEPFSADGLTVYRAGGEENDGTPIALSADEYRVSAEGYNANRAGVYTVTVEDLSGLAEAVTYEVKVLPADSLRLLIIGNSFGDDAMAHLYDAARSVGIPEESICLANLFIGGCSLATHLSHMQSGAAAYEFHIFGEGGSATVTNYTLDMGLAYTEWDFVMLQQVSQDSGKSETYAPLDTLLPYVREKAPSARLAFHMTWAYQQNSTHGGFPAYGSNQMNMYDCIVTAVAENVLTRDFDVLVPSGTAIQNARTSYLGDTLTRDGYHLTLNYGRYTAALTVLGALTGVDPTDVSYAPIGLWGDHISVCRESAYNALANDWWQVTPSAYTEEPTFDLSGYTKLEIDFTVGKYWHSMAAGAHNILNGSGEFGMKFAATKRFTPEELPVGAVIFIAEGWQARPEAWKDDALQTSRPDGLGAGYILVDETFFDGYIYRAFNISRSDGSSLADYADVLDEVFCIYIPAEDTE